MPVCKRFPGLLVFVLSAQLGLAAPAPPALERVALKDAVARALEFNHSLRIAREQIREAEAERSSAVSGVFFPEVSLRLGTGLAKDAASSLGARFNAETFGTYTGSLEARQSLLRGAALWDGVRALDRKIEIQRASYEKAERDQIVAVVQSFYRVLLARKKIETYERVQRTQQSLLAKAQRRFRVGSERKLTVLRFQTEAALLAPKIIQARNELETSSVDLLNLLGDRRSPSFEVVGSFERAAALPVPEAAASADDKQPELRVQQLEQHRLDALKGVEMAKHWPSLDLAASIGRQGTTGGDLFDNDNTTWSAGLTLTIPLFSGLSSFRDREVFAARDAQLRISERRLRDELARNRILVTRELDSVRSLLQAQQSALSLARESYSTAQQNYNLGTATYSTLFETEQALIETELSYAQTEYDYLVKLTQYYVVAGRPLKELIDSI